MQLAEYMAANGLDDAALAAKVNRSRVTVSRWRRKLETPSSQAIPVIVAACDGEVTANDLLGIEPAGVGIEPPEPTGGGVNAL